jgi:hypothetical protein
MPVHKAISFNSMQQQMIAAALHVRRAANRALMHLKRIVLLALRQPTPFIIPHNV